MPFTPAHVAAVIPLRGRAGLPFAALAAGSMSPDLPYYLLGTGWQPVPATHSLWAVPTWDLLFGLVMWAAFRRASQPLHDLSPEVVRRRWRLADVAASRWWLTPVAVLIGSLTHLLWDEFTHPGRFGTANLAMLAATYPSPIGPLEGYRYLQYGSGLFGLAVLAWVGLRASVGPAVPRRQPVLAAWARWWCSPEDLWRPSWASA